MLSDDNADIFAVSALISCCSFSYVTLSSTVMISFYIFSKIFCLKREQLSDAKVISIANKKHGFTVPFYKH